MPSLGRTHRQGQGVISCVPPAEGRDSAESIEAPRAGSVVPGLEGTLAPSHVCHKPTGGGIALALLWLHPKWAPAWELLVSAPMVIPGDGGQH